MENEEAQNLKKLKTLIAKNEQVIQDDNTNDEDERFINDFNKVSLESDDSIIPENLESSKSGEEKEASQNASMNEPLLFENNLLEPEHDDNQGQREEWNGHVSDTIEGENNEKVLPQNEERDEHKESASLDEMEKQPTAEMSKLETNKKQQNEERKEKELISQDNAEELLSWLNQSKMSAGKNLPEEALNETNNEGQIVSLLEKEEEATELPVEKNQSESRGELTEMNIESEDSKTTAELDGLKKIEEVENILESLKQELVEEKLDHHSLFNNPKDAVEKLSQDSKDGGSEQKYDLDNEISEETSTSFGLF